MHERMLHHKSVACVEIKLLRVVDSARACKMIRAVMLMPEVKIKTQMLDVCAKYIGKCTCEMCGEMHTQDVQNACVYARW